jgi:cyclopropane-fatty-acyl-phospholipid synthase
MTRDEKIVTDLLAKGDVRVGGERPHDIAVHDARFFSAVVRGGFTAAREAYVDGWWDCDALDVLTAKVLAAEPDFHWANRIQLALRHLTGRLLNRQHGRRGRMVARHYDLGNDLYEAMLDRSMTYSCAYWEGAETLDQAQEAKLDLVCRKAGLRPGMRVLDVGCGFGSFCRFAASRYGISVVGITISREQLESARERCKGLPVELRLQDYRDLNEPPFDAIVSIGMFEHVGYRNYRRFFRQMRRHMRPEGLFVLHSSGGLASEVSYDPWMDRHIFPRAHLPSARQITTAVEGLLLIEDWHNFGVHYDPTLMAWYENFTRAWDRLETHYDERFRRIWRCYLLTCAGSFRQRLHQVWQVVFSPRGVAGGYTSVR